jgi:hypothetical protein
MLYECLPTILGSEVVIKSNRDGSNLNICEIEVYGFGTSTFCQCLMLVLDNLVAFTRCLSDQFDCAFADSRPFIGL